MYFLKGNKLGLGKKDNNITVISIVFPLCVVEKKGDVFDPFFLISKLDSCDKDLSFCIIRIIYKKLSRVNELFIYFLMKKGKKSLFIMFFI